MNECYKLCTLVEPITGTNQTTCLQHQPACMSKEDEPLCKSEQSSMVRRVMTRH